MLLIKLSWKSRKIFDLKLEIDFDEKLSALLSDRFGRLQSNFMLFRA